MNVDAIDRPAVKARAKEIIRTARPKVIYASLIFLILVLVLGGLYNQLVGVSVENITRYVQYMDAGDYERAMNVLVSRSPSAVAQLVGLLIECVEIIVGLGFTIFLLNTIRGTGAVYGNLLDGFGYWWKVLVLDLVIGIFVALWSLLLIIPGIVAAYRYSMANYLLLTRPDLGIMECIRESKRLTQGHKGELFVLDLSFIGWSFLCAIPVVGWILFVWLTPYMNISHLLYYEKLAGLDTDTVIVDDPWNL